MRPRRKLLWCAAALVCLQGGCGTFLNLSAPSTSPQLLSCFLAPPSSCMPFGGTLRSAMFGGVYLICGMGEGAEELGHGGLLKGAGMVGIGLGALVVDTPLSFVGDLVTFPVASARQQGAPWATWWGEQAAPKTPGPAEVQQRQSEPAATHAPASQAVVGGLPDPASGKSGPGRWPD